MERQGKLLQTTDTIVMVAPDYFGYNSQTATDNSYQTKFNISDNTVRLKASHEFGNMVEILDDHNAHVVVLKSRDDNKDEIPHDAVFPNNWFSTHPQTLVFYPMKTLNRRAERQPEELIRKLKEINIIYPNILDLRSDEQDGMYLEGTGSMVLDRVNSIAYSIASERTISGEFEKWCQQMNYEPCFFHAIDSDLRPVYHTNLVMSIGSNFAVICTETITDLNQRHKVIDMLRNSNRQIIEITLEQMYNMCGNVLEITNSKRESIIVMSERARKKFTKQNISKLEQNGLVLPVAIPTIETVGGGSARCMMAEIFY